MTDSPRWERESHEDLRPSTPQPSQSPRPALPQETVEFDVTRAGAVDPDELRDPPEYGSTLGADWLESGGRPGPAAADADGRSDGDGRFEEDEQEEWSDEEAAREPRLAGARESLAATRESMGESLAATRESLGESLSAGRRSVAAGARRAGRWIASLDRRPEFDAHLRHDPVAGLAAGPATDEPAGSLPSEPTAAEPRAAEPRPAEPRPAEPRAADRRAAEPEDAGAEPALTAEPRFPTAPLGYNRHAVDSHLAMLEAELARLREVAEPTPPSISEEIERLGEQTASILVVAHDRAHETARRAQAQAARAVSEAAEDAQRITAEAERRLRELDEETDAVWRERERLLEDIREVSRSLVTLADAAGERFPAADSPEPAAAPVE